MAQPFTSSMPIVDPLTGRLTSVGLQTLNQLVSTINGEINNGVTTVKIGGNTLIASSGSPQGVVSAGLGAIYINTSGGAGSTFWVKEANDGANTGWQAK